jgi:hypothetical protein
MAETAADRAKALEQSVNATKHLSEASQQKAIDAVLGQPTQRTTNWLWKAVVTGLLVVLSIAIGGIIGLLATGHMVDTVVTVFTATLTGLVGLFVPSPVDKGSGSSTPTPSPAPTPSPSPSPTPTPTPAPPASTGQGVPSPPPPQS